MRDYHRLEFWRRAHALAIAIHETARGLRGNRVLDRFVRSSLGPQTPSLQPSSKAVERQTNREFARFLDMSIKSASETEYHLLSARDRRALVERRWRSVLERGRMRSDA